MDSDFILNSILKSAQEEGMPSVFRFCRDDKKYGRVLFSSASNLKALIRAGMGQVGDMLVRTRKDLKSIKDWTDFCQAVANGFSYSYAVEDNDDSFEVRSLYDFPPTVSKIEFNLVGLMPPQGCQGFIFMMTSIRQQEGTLDITSKSQVISVGGYKEDVVTLWFSSFILTASSERSKVTGILIQDGVDLNTTREFQETNEDELRRTVLELWFNIKFQQLCSSTTTFLSKGTERWRFVMKMKEIAF